MKKPYVVMVTLENGNENNVIVNVLISNSANEAEADCIVRAKENYGGKYASSSAFLLDANKLVLELVEKCNLEQATLDSLYETLVIGKE